MDDVNSFLADWSIRFLKNKDSIRQEITKIERNCGEFNFAVHYKDKVRQFIISPLLGENIFAKLKEDGHFAIISLNNPANIRFVVSQWEKLINFKFLSIYFVNPFSDSEKVWTIIPYVHDKICDKGSLELGLNSMAGMSAAIGMEELNRKVKSMPA